MRGLVSIQHPCIDLLLPCFDHASIIFTIMHLVITNFLCLLTLHEHAREFRYIEWHGMFVFVKNESKSHSYVNLVEHMPLYFCTFPVYFY